MNKEGINKKQLFRVVVILLVMVFLASAAMFVLDIWERGRGKFPEKEILEKTLELDGKSYVLKENVETFLVMGLDKTHEQSVSDAYNNDRQSDFIMLFVFDNDNKKCSALHINRDTMAELGVLGVNGNRVSTRTAQIALAHTYGNGRDTSCRNTADAVSELLYGAKINHYISFTMDSVSVINDMVGGVEVEVLDDLTALDPSFTKGERVLLSGEQALSYVRSRRELPDSTNKTRMVRQQQYINSLWEKASKLLSEDAEALASSAYKLSDYIVSDRSLTQLEALAKKIASYEFAGIFELSGENFIGEKYIEFYPDEQSVLENVTKLFYKLKD